MVLEIDFQTLTIWEIIEGVHTKNLKATIVCRFLQGIWFYTHRKDGANTMSSWSSKRDSYCYKKIFLK